MKKLKSTDDMGSITLFVFCSFVYLFTLLSSKSYALSLVEAYEAALNNDPQLQVARAEYLAGLESVKIARGGLLPQISAIGSYQERDTETSGVFPITLDQDQNPVTPEIRALRPVENESDETSETWSVSLRQPLFDASRWFNYKRGKYETEQSKYQLKAEQQTLLFRVVSAYFDVLKAKESLYLAKMLEKADEKQLSRARRRAKVGANAQLDVYQSQAAYDASISNRLYEEDNLGSAVDALQNITGLYTQALWQLKQDFDVLPPDPEGIEKWLNLAFNNSASIKAALADSKAAKATFKSAQSEHLPTIYLELGYNDTDSQTNEVDNDLPFDFDSKTQGSSISITATMPLFSGGQTRSQARQAKYRYQAAKASHRRILEETRRQVKTTYRNALANVNRISVNKRAVESSQKALEATQKGYNTGIHDINDVIMAQRNYYNALRDFNNTQYDYLVQMVELKLLVGLLTPADLYEMNNRLIQAN